MELIVIPGFWMNASAWADVVPALEADGHTVRVLTLPGLASVDDDRSGIGLADHVAAAVAAVDEATAASDGTTDVVLVGHSGGGAIAHAVVDARPDQVSRVVYVDCGPLADGGVINDELPVVGDEIPLPDWSVFDDEDLVDLDGELRERFRTMAVAHPAGVASDPVVLHDPRRYDVPATVIACEFGSSVLRELIAAGHPYTAELARLRDVTMVDLPTGHWPMLTRPADLARAISAALR